MNPVLQALRFSFRAGKLHAVVVEEVIPGEVLAVLRDRVRPGLRPFEIADRGRYQIDEELEQPEITGVLAEVAAAIIEEDVVCSPGARWQRFVHGDYALYKDDSVRRRVKAAPYELVLDFSAAASGDAQVVYFDEGIGFVVPQQPGLLSIVDRRGNVRRYDRYLNHRLGEAEVFRVSVPLSNR